MPPVATTAVAFAGGLDLVGGEFPERLHPVVVFGRAVAPLERGWEHPLWVGSVAAVVLPLTAAGVAGVATAAAIGVHPYFGAAVAALVLFSTTSLRMLAETGRRIAHGSATDLPAARRALPALAGRDATELSEGQVRSAAVESVAENLADGLVGPLSAFAVLAPVSLALAAACAAWVKAVNTMDSMLGYPGEPVGTASARLDDVVMWVPARLSAALLCLVALAPAALATASRWARRPASPNAGWPMATMAAILDVRLEKPGAYVLKPDAPLPSVDDADRAVALVWLAGALAYVAAGVFAWG